MSTNLLMRHLPDSALSEQDVLDWLRTLRGRPHVPASRFDVTTVFRARIAGQGGWYFAGVNVENADHRLSTHGEEGAISAAVTALGRNVELVEGWVLGAPRELQPGDEHELADLKVACCGKCRQQLAGLAAPEMPIHAVSLNGEFESMTLGEQLPNIFSFRQFAPELVEQGEIAIKVPSVDEAMRRIHRTGPLDEAEVIEWMSSLQSADFASHMGQHVVIRLGEAGFVAGTAVEEAAFVSINACQAALANAAVVAAAHPPAVTEIWCMSVDREGGTPVRGLTMSAVQSLLEFVEDPSAVRMHICTSEGVQQSLTLAESVLLAPSLSSD